MTNHYKIVNFLGFYEYNYPANQLASFPSNIWLY